MWPRVHAAQFVTSAYTPASTSALTLSFPLQSVASKTKATDGAGIVAGCSAGKACTTLSTVNLQAPFSRFPPAVAKQSLALSNFEQLESPRPACSRTCVQSGFELMPLQF